MRTTTKLAAVLALFATVGIAGCAKSMAGPAVVSPGSEPTADEPEGLAEGDSAAELDARKDKLVEQLKDVEQMADTDPQVCEDLCSLATSICGMTLKLCSIADDHAGNDDYQNLCREAKRDCREAQEDCVACAESLASSGASATCEGAPAEKAEPVSSEPAPASEPAKDE